MTFKTVELVGPHGVVIGSDLWKDQPKSIVTWMRSGHWTKAADYGKGSDDALSFTIIPD